jgi:hypothetical protein
MALDKDEIGQLKGAFKEALTERDKERAEEVRKAAEAEAAKVWKAGDPDRRKDKSSGGRRKEPAAKKSRGLFGGSAAA